jgi:hypothetical protein
MALATGEASAKIGAHDRNATQAIASSTERRTIAMATQDSSAAPAPRNCFAYCDHLLAVDAGQVGMPTGLIERGRVRLVAINVRRRRSAAGRVGRSGVTGVV